MRPLPWLTLLALLLVLLGVSVISRLALRLALPDAIRYGGDVGVLGQADYSFWPFGPLMPPVDAQAIAAQIEDLPVPTGESAQPPADVPITVIDAPTALPTATASPVVVQPSPSPSRTTVSPTATATASPSPSPSRTTAPPRVPTQAASSPTRVPVAATPLSPPVTATATAVSLPGAPPAPSVPPTATAQPTATRTVQPTSSPIRTAVASPTSIPVRTATAAPPVPTLTATATATRTPEPDVPLMSFADPALVASEEQGQVTFVVRLSIPAIRAVSVGYSTGGGTATSNVDYQAASGTLNFSPGELAKSITLVLTRDRLNEPSETVELRLATPTNAVVLGANAALLTITDSDAPPRISLDSAARRVSESAGSASVTVELSQPSAIDISVPYSISGSASAEDHELRGGTLVLRAGTTSARLRFNIVADKVDEDDETILVALGTPSNADLDNPSVAVLTIVDDDTVRVRVSPATLNLAEGGAVGAYTVVLESQPVAPVTVQIAHDNQVSLAPASLTFTSGDWSTPRIVQVAALGDFVDEPDRYTSTLKHTVSSTDLRYAGFAAEDVVVAIADDDTAGVLILPNQLGLREKGPASAYTVALRSEPVAPVTITLAPDSQLTANQSVLRFDASNWKQPQPVVVVALDDAIDEPDTHRGTLAHTAKSVDPLYNGIAIAPLVVTITDDDTAGVIVQPLQLNLNEGQTDDYTVVLNSQPTKAVTITLAPNTQLQLVSTTQLVFTPQTWNVAQKVTIIAPTNDLDADYPLVTIAHTTTSLDPLYSRIKVDDVRITLFDDDTAGVTVAPTSVTIAEGATSTYGIRLNSEPTKPVTVTLAPDAQLKPVTPTQLVFTAQTWNITQTVILTAFDDDIDENDFHTGTLVHTVVSADPDYGGRLVPAVVVTILDDDTAGVIVAPVALTIEEGAGATYSVRLASEPTTTVTIALTQTPAGMVDTKPSNLSFTPLTWTVAQTITVSAENNNIDDDDRSTTIAHTVTSADPNYNAIVAATVSVTVEDNDEAGVIVTPTGLGLTEGEAAEYKVVLASEPTAPVAINLAPSNGRVTASVAVLNFDPTNWNAPQTIVLTTQDDAVADGPDRVTIAHAATSADTKYNQFAVASVVVEIADNDQAGVEVTPLALDMVEGDTATYTLRLTSQPTAPVTINFGPTPAGQLGIAPTSLSFDAANWNLAQPVTVAAPSNFVDDDDRVSTIAHAATSADLGYNAIAVASVQVTVRDDDTAGVTVAPTTLMLSEEPGAADHSALYSAVLASQPTAEVVLTIATDAQLQASAAQLVFTPLNWNVAQNVTLTALDDAIDEASPHFGAVAHTVASVDPKYNGRPVSGLVASILDNDTAGVLVAPPLVAQTDENGATASFSLRLTSQPTAPVSVGLATSDPSEGVLLVPTVPLVFDAATWNIPQLVTVAGVDDLLFDGHVLYNVQIAPASSADPNYNGLAASAATIALTNRDNEPVLVELADAARAEGNSAHRTLSFALTFQFAVEAPVTIGYETFALSATPGVDYEPISDTVTVMPGTLATTLVVLMRGDTEYEPDEQLGLRLTSISVAGELAILYDTEAIGTIRNDDRPELRFAPGTYTVQENAGVVLVTVELEAAVDGEVVAFYDTRRTGGGLGDAVRDEDYQHVEGQLHFAPGETVKTIALPILNNDDLPEERYETLKLRLTRSTGEVEFDPVELLVTIVEDGP